MPADAISKPLLSSLQLMDDNEELQSLLSSSHCSQDHLKGQVGLEVLDCVLIASLTVF